MRIIFCFCSAIVLLASGCSSSAKAVSVSPQPELRFMQVTETANSFDIEVPARIQPDPLRVVRLFAPVSGRVTSIIARPGDRVRAGEVIAKIQSPDIAAAQADLQRCHAESERASRAEARAKDLLEHQVLSEREFEDAHAAAEGAKADETRAKSRLRLLTHDEQVSGDEIYLRSPISGVVVDVQGSAGEFTKSLDNSNPLVTVADLSRVFVVGDVLESELGRVRAGMHADVRLTSLPNAIYKGSLDSVSQVMDPATHTAKLRLIVDNRGALLRPDMFGTVTVHAGTEKLFRLPSAAIVRDGTQAFVFVKTGSGPQKRAVNVLKESNGESYVSGGIASGDSVVVEGAALLRGEG